MADEKNSSPLHSSIEGEAIGKEIGSGLGQITVADVREIKDADEAMRAFADYDGAGEVIDEATSRRLLRKIDMRIMPVCKR